MLDRDGKVITSDEFKPYYLVYITNKSVDVLILQADKHKKQQYLNTAYLGHRAKRY